MVGRLGSVDGRMEYKPLSSEHIGRLQEIRAEYVSHRYLRLSKAGDTLELRLSLQVEELEEPFRSQGLSIIRRKDKESIESRMEGLSLQLVVQDKGRLIGLLDVEIEPAQGVGRVWNLLIDERYRQRGIGTELIKRARDFARANDCRAITVETQATNWPALNFYVKMGFQICGLDDHLYTNEDLERKQVALFLYHEL